MVSDRLVIENILIYLFQIQSSLTLNDLNMVFIYNVVSLFEFFKMSYTFCSNDISKGVENNGLPLV